MPKYTAKVTNAAGAEVTLGDPRATERLRRALADDRAEVRFQAVMAFPRVSVDRGPALEALLHATGDEDATRDEQRRRHVTGRTCRVSESVRTLRTDAVRVAPSGLGVRLAVLVARDEAEGRAHAQADHAGACHDDPLRNATWFKFGAAAQNPVPVHETYATPWGDGDGTGVPSALTLSRNRR